MKVENGRTAVPNGRNTSLAADATNRAAPVTAHSSPWRVFLMRWSAAIAIILIGGAVAASLLSPIRGEPARGAVALFLYGQSDPDHIEAAGLHGLGGHLTKVTLTAIGPCRFTVATAALSEAIDFDRVLTVRHFELGDPAAGLSGMLGGTSALPARSKRLAVAVVDGLDDAICSASGCLKQRAFALSDLGRLEQARAAAADFLSRLCPGRRNTPPRPTTAPQAR